MSTSTAVDQIRQQMETTLLAMLESDRKLKVREEELDARSRQLDAREEALGERERAVEEKDKAVEERAAAALAELQEREQAYAELSKKFPLGSSILDVSVGGVNLPT